MAARLCRVALVGSARSPFRPSVLIGIGKNFESLVRSRDVRPKQRLEWPTFEPAECPSESLPKYSSNHRSQHMSRSRRRALVGAAAPSLRSRSLCLCCFRCVLCARCVLCRAAVWVRAVPCECVLFSSFRTLCVVWRSIQYTFTIFSFSSLSLIYYLRCMLMLRCERHGERYSIRHSRFAFCFCRPSPLSLMLPLVLADC